MYDPRIGRFISTDPSGFSGGDANLYRYVGNDPLNKVDPTGLAARILGGGNVSIVGSTSLLNLPSQPLSSSQIAWMPGTAPTPSGADLYRSNLNGMLAVYAPADTLVARMARQTDDLFRVTEDQVAERMSDEAFRSSFAALTRMPYIEPPGPSAWGMMQAEAYRTMRYEEHLADERGFNRLGGVGNIVNAIGGVFATTFLASSF